MFHAGADSLRSSRNREEAVAIELASVLDLTSADRVDAFRSALDYSSCGSPRLGFPRTRPRIWIRRAAHSFGHPPLTAKCQVGSPKLRADATASFGSDDDRCCLLGDF